MSLKARVSIRQPNFNWSNMSSHLARVREYTFIISIRELLEHKVVKGKTINYNRKMISLKKKLETANDCLRKDIFFPGINS